MKIATWNVERPRKGSSRVPEIISCLGKLNPDIIILTESNTCIDLGPAYEVIHTLADPDPYYTEGECRVSIFTKFSVIEQIPTFRNDMSVCVLMDTPEGPLAIYGTVIGKTGNRSADYQADLTSQIEDIRIIASFYNLCIAGDLNMSFSDNYYFTQDGRRRLNKVFAELKLMNTTFAIPENVDHIVVPDTICKGLPHKAETWNTDKLLSDHQGVAVIIECDP